VSILATSAGHLKYWQYGKTREFRVKLNFAPKNSRTFYPENDILVRNQIQLYSKKYPVNTIWLLEQNKCRMKKKTLTGQRRNTIMLKHLMFQSCDYPHFICISFRQFDCYIYIILWAPYRWTNMVATGDSCFWLADLFSSSPLKLLSQMNRNLVGSNYGSSSIDIAHFIPIPQTEHKYDLSRISWYDSRKWYLGQKPNTIV
jgi:hypothetical protein